MHNRRPAAMQAKDRPANSQADTAQPAGAVCGPCNLLQQAVCLSGVEFIGWCSFQSPGQVNSLDSAIVLSFSANFLLFY
ncbi:MAG: hypothetical protein ACUVR4_10280 [Anaerolineae bacterium]